MLLDPHSVGYLSTCPIYGYLPGFLGAVQLSGRLPLVGVSTKRWRAAAWDGRRRSKAAAYCYAPLSLAAH